MDGNKEEAIKILDLAENKFKSQDIEGAMQLALKAQKLFPSLRSLKQTLAAYEVHLAAATKKLSSGQTDWHAVLRVDPSADYNTIRKQFKNMCLLTHPDKNRCSSAADSAFMMVMKAWSILSTKSSSSSSSSSGTKQQKNPKETKENPKEPKSRNRKYLYAKIRCKECGLLRHWDFSRTDAKSLHHYCKFCSTWCEVRTRPAKVNVPLTCEGCCGNLSWGPYCPIGYECSSCGSYYVVGVDPTWVPKSQPGSETLFRPETVSCPYCGAWNKYKVDNDTNKFFVSCKQCGLRSIVELETY